MVLQEEKKENINLLKVGYTFLILSIIIVGGLFMYNYSLEIKIASINDSISKSDTAINAKKTDKKIQVYNLLKENKEVIKDLDKKSQINKYIYHLREMQNNSRVIFKGFSYSNGVISTTAYVPFGIGEESAAIRTESFIKGYREDKDKKALFDLEFINTFNGYDSMTFNVNLKLKNNL